MEHVLPNGRSCLEDLFDAVWEKEDTLKWVDRFLNRVLRANGGKQGRLFLCRLLISKLQWDVTSQRMSSMILSHEFTRSNPEEFLAHGLFRFETVQVLCVIFLAKFAIFDENRGSKIQ